MGMVQGILQLTPNVLLPSPKALFHYFFSFKLWYLILKSCSPWFKHSHKTQDQSGTKVIAIFSIFANIPLLRQIYFSSFTAVHFSFERACNSFSLSQSYQEGQDLFWKFQAEYWIDVTTYLLKIKDMCLKWLIPAFIRLPELLSSYL